jgi:hypothetical protein
MAQGPINPTCTSHAGFSDLTIIQELPIHLPRYKQMLQA